MKILILQLFYIYTFWTVASTKEILESEDTIHNKINDEIIKTQQKPNKIHSIPKKLQRNFHQNSYTESNKYIEPIAMSTTMEHMYEGPIELEESKEYNVETEKLRVKHHHHHHNHMKTVIKKVPQLIEKVVHILKPYPVEKIVHVPKPYPVEKIVERSIPVEKIVYVPVEKVVEKIVDIPKPYPVEKIIHLPKPYPVIKRIPYPVYVKIPVYIPKLMPNAVQEKIPYSMKIENEIPYSENFYSFNTNENNNDDSYSNISSDDKNYGAETNHYFVKIPNENLKIVQHENEQRALKNINPVISQAQYFHYLRQQQQQQQKQYEKQQEQPYQKQQDEDQHQQMQEYQQQQQQQQSYLHQKNNSRPLVNQETTNQKVIEYQAKRSNYQIADGLIINYPDFRTASESRALSSRRSSKDKF